MDIILSSFIPSRGLKRFNNFKNVRKFELCSQIFLFENIHK
jgi:hypothetical protein